MRQKRINILFALAHGFLPWSEPSHKGFDYLHLMEGDEGLYYALCCGHRLSLDEVREWVDEGLLVPAQDGRDAFLAGPKARKWLNEGYIPLEHVSRVLAS